MNYKFIPVIPAKRLLAALARFILSHNLLILLCWLVLLPACQPSGETWARVQNAGILRVGLDPTYPPFENADGGQLEGYDVDLARTLAEEMGVEAEFVYFGYDGLYDALATRQVDVLLSALVIQPERTRDFAYSEPYFDVGQRLVVPAGSPVQNIDDLSGLSIAVELGAEGHVQATQLARRLPNLEIITFDTAGEALAGVANGESAAAIVDNIAALIHPDPNLHIISLPVTVEPFALVVRIDDEQLLRELNQALSRLEENGRLESIRQAWFNQ